MPASPIQHDPSAASVIVWYDGGCPLCLREIRLMRRLDKRQRIEFVDASDAATVCPRDRDLMLQRFHASENGVLLSGAAAFAAMWRAIPLLRPLGLAARWPWFLRLLESAYLRFLRIRPRLQKMVR
jgi:predicted DCC family thiol-disulfide oxidoreductase YuxK